MRLKTVRAANLPGTRRLAPVLERHPTVFAVVLLIGALALGYNNIIFLGQSLVASSDYHPFDYRWDIIRTGGNTGDAIANWHDLGGVWWQWEPAGSFFSHAYRNGRVPLWDPTLAGGVDAHVGLVQGQYYPPYIILLLLSDAPWMRDAYYLLQLLTAGFFCYLLLRRNGYSVMAGVSMGVAYMLGGALSQNVNSILGQSFAVLPLMIWSADYAMSRVSLRRTGVSALVLSLCTLSSFLPIVISGFLLIGLYALIAAAFHPRVQQGWWLNTKSVIARVWPPVAAVALAVVITAFILIPVEFASAHDAAFTKWYKGIGLLTFGPDQLLEIVSPSLSYDVWQTRDPNALLFAKKYEIGFFYVGLVPIALAFLARPGKTPEQRRLFTFFAAGCVLVLGKLLGFPPIQWIGYLPVLRALHFVPYFCGAFALCAAGLAGLGVETLAARKRKGMIAGTGLAVLAVFVALVRFAEVQPLNSSLQGPVLWSAIARFALEAGRIGLVALGLLSIVILRVLRLRGAQAAGCALALITIELVPLACRQRFLRSDVWNTVPPYVAFLRSDHSLFRVHGVHDLALTPDVSQGLGIACISSRLPFNSDRYSGLVRTFFTAPDLPYPLVKSLAPTSRVVLDLLNVKYLLLFSPSQAEIAQMTAAGLVPAFDDGLFHVYRNPTVWPRAYIARTVRATDGPTDSLRAVATLQAGEAVIEGAPQISSSPVEASVDSIQDDLDSVVIKVHAAAPAFLVLSENAAPGWQATVQGKPAKILFANHAFQAVELPAGASEVHFRYRTPGLTLGLALSGVGFAGALAMIVIPTVRTRKRVIMTSAGNSKESIR